jgi:hypothetical protein
MSRPDRKRKKVSAGFKKYLINMGKFTDYLFYAYLTGIKIYL